jgi:hypothetical protein
MSMMPVLEEKLIDEASFHIPAGFATWPPDRLFPAARQAKDFTGAFPAGFRHPRSGACL